MARKAINKVIFAGVTLVDLTGDTITAADVMNGVRFHLPSGDVAFGTYVPGDSGTNGAQGEAAMSGGNGEQSGE